MDTRLVRQKFSELVREPAAEFDLLRRYSEQFSKHASPLKPEGDSQ